MNKIITTSPEETIEFAKKIGAVLKKGDVIAYKGGLGAGKTTFTRGLAMGAGLEDEVYSPTFALINEYAGDVNIYHFDMYRITSEEDLYSTGYEEAILRGITVCEWSENIEDFLPEHYIRIVFSKRSESERIISVERV